MLAQNLRFIGESNFASDAGHFLRNEFRHRSNFTVSDNSRPRMISLCQMELALFYPTVNKLF